METNRTDNFSWKNAIEKTILRVLGSREFSHSLDAKRTSSKRADHHGRRARVDKRLRGFVLVRLTSRNEASSG
jgi:hypothetical protein